MAELEEKIRELKEVRATHVQERSRLEQERKDCHEQLKQLELEVDAIATQVEELKVIIR